MRDFDSHVADYFPVELRYHKKMSELSLVIEFDGGVALRVVLEPHQVQMQHWREHVEAHALLCLLQAVLARVVLVLTV